MRRKKEWSGAKLTAKHMLRLDMLNFVINLSYYNMHLNGVALIKLQITFAVKYK